MTFSGPTSRRNWRIASRNGCDSMSPTVPPTSVMTTSVSVASATERIRALISLVIGGAGEVLVDEALVVPDVEIGLGAVLGHEDLAVLEGAHRARVDVQVRVE